MPMAARDLSLGSPRTDRGDVSQARRQSNCWDIRNEVRFPQATEGAAGKCLPRAHCGRTLQSGEGRHGRGTFSFSAIGVLFPWLGRIRSELTFTVVVGLPTHPSATLPFAADPSSER